MGVKFRGGHRHVHLMAVMALAAAHLLPKCCRALCKGMRRQAQVDASGMLSTMIVGGFQEEVSEVTHVRDTEQRFWDDISGKELNPELVHAAREEELKLVDEMGVWEVRPVS